jgi:hypothetical protein
MVQVVEHSPSKHEALSSIPSTSKRRRRKKKKEEEEEEEEA